LCDDIIVLQIWKLWGIILTSKIVMNGRLLYYQPEMARLITDLADKATNTCVGE